MGDMGDYWRDVQASNKQRKILNLEAAELFDWGPISWTKHTDYHWSTYIGAPKLDFWPSTMKWTFREKRYHGDCQKLVNFIRNRIRESGGPYERGDADAYYGRRPHPRKKVGTQEVDLTNDRDIALFWLGYEENPTGKKDYGDAT